MLVGAGSDLLGYFIFDMSGYGFFPQITLTYALLGFIPYFLFALIKLIRNRKAMFLIETISLIGLVVMITLIFNFNNSEWWLRYLIPSLLAVSTVIVLLFSYFYQKHLDKKGIELPINTYQLSLSLFIIEVVVMVLFGTLMKACAFGFGIYSTAVVTQMVVLFVNILLNTVLISLLLKITKNKFKFENQNSLKEN